MTQKFEEILSDLKQKKFKPVYFLEGEEAFYIDAISDFIENNSLSDAEKSFNQSVLYGKDSNWKQVLDTAMRFPMMSNFQVVILKEAADLKDFDNLNQYFEKPLPSTIFVVCYKHKELDKRKTLGKLISKSENIIHLKAEAIKEWDVENWMKNYVHQQGYKIRTETTTLLKEYLGTDLSKIANELSKLFLNCDKHQEIGNDSVEKFIGISKDYNVYELQKSLGTKNFQQAFKFVQYSIANDKANPMVMVVASLYGYFSKILIYQNCQGMSEGDTAKAIGIFSQYPTKILADYKIASHNYSSAKIKRVFGILHEYDLKSKGVNTSDSDKGGLMKEMIGKLMNM